MSLEHLHLFLNHIPVVGIPIALVSLLYAKRKNNEQMMSATFVFLFVIGVCALVTYLTGEPAEKAIDGIPGITEALIHPHEEAGELGLVATGISVALAVLAMVVNRAEKWARYRNLILNSLLVVLFLNATVLARVAYLGGQIRHSEIRSESN